MKYILSLNIVNVWQNIESKMKLVNYPNIPIEKTLNFNLELTRLRDINELELFNSLKVNIDYFIEGLKM